MRKLYENYHIFHFQKRIVSTETKYGTLKIIRFSCNILPYTTESKGMLENHQMFMQNITPHMLCGGGFPQFQKAIHAI